MRPRVCKNCGSTEFHQVENGWQCDYCGTLYLTAEAASVPVEETKTGNWWTSKKKRMRLMLLGGMFLIILGGLRVIQHAASTETGSTEQKTNVSYAPLVKTAEGREAKMPGNWNQATYDSLTIATEHYNSKTEKYEYRGGANYQELEKIVGKPDTVTSWEKEDDGVPPRVDAEWDHTPDGQYAKKTITVTYDKKNQMITSKSIN